MNVADTPDPKINEELKKEPPVIPPIPDKGEETGETGWVYVDTLTDLYIEVSNQLRSLIAAVEAREDAAPTSSR